MEITVRWRSTNSWMGLYIDFQLGVHFATCSKNSTTYSFKTCTLVPPVHEQWISICVWIEIQTKHTCNRQETNTSNTYSPCSETFWAANAKTIRVHKQSWGGSTTRVGGFWCSKNVTPTTERHGIFVCVFFQVKLTSSLILYTLWLFNIAMV